MKNKQKEQTHNIKNDKEEITIKTKETFKISLHKCMHKNVKAHMKKVTF